LASNEPSDHEVLVAADGSMPAEQLKRLDVHPGTQLRVLSRTEPKRVGGSVAGSLPHLPDVSRDDFQRAGELARRDLSGG
jgi:hypothetical protein